MESLKEKNQACLDSNDKLIKEKDSLRSELDFYISIRNRITQNIYVKSIVKLINIQKFYLKKFNNFIIKIKYIIHTFFSLDTVNFPFMVLLNVLNDCINFQDRDL